MQRLPDFSQEVTDVSYNSLTVKPGTLFLCKGANFKEAYLADALAKAPAAMWQHAI